MRIIDDLRQQGCTVSLTGSRETCDPPPMDTDEDYLVELPWSFWGHGKVFDLISNAGFHKDGTEYGGQKGQFESWRNGPVNLIVTADAAFAAKHRAATYVCKTLNLLRKEDRVMVFQAVLYGNTPAFLPEEFT